MNTNMIGNLAFGANQTKPAASAGRDLMTVSRIIGDETGRYSMEEKGAAYRDYREMIGNLSHYSAEQRKEAADLRDNSSFMQKLREMRSVIDAAIEPIGAAINSGKGMKNTDALTLMINALDSIPPEDLALEPDYDGLKERLLVERELYRTLEAREAAGAYKPGPIIEDVTDPAARQALEMLKQINDVYMTQRTLSQKTEDVKPVLASIRDRLGLDAEGNRTSGSSSSRWQDTVTLSPEAQRIMGGG
ncbi:MAG: hypothetical protein QUV20_15655 [Oceanibaculum nanhaiense]|uniref:hypothetical protein n=1 Tax=Oceanibaculum nanhaiense TaxID=1909734 RepID=UPI0025A38B4B|nr:hypothetical protein [Oceanibaculum nanhaiense]MDM7947762.1 hypothetical protein [Oceanibaculum nanhaiense]